MHKNKKLIEIREWKVIYKSDKKEYSHLFEQPYKWDLKNNK